MEQVYIIRPDEFWEKQREIIKQVLLEEKSKQPSPTDADTDIILIEDVQRILKKSKQTIYNWMDAGILNGYYVNESLYFLRSEIIDVVKSGKALKEHKKG
jgi:hypothetical protein